MNYKSYTPTRTSGFRGSIRKLAALFAWMVTSWVRPADSEAGWQQR